MNTRGRTGTVDYSMKLWQYYSDATGETKKNPHHVSWKLAGKPPNIHPPGTKKKCFIRSMGENFEVLAAVLAEDSDLLGYDDAAVGNRIPTFRVNVMSSSRAEMCKENGHLYP